MTQKDKELLLKDLCTRLVYMPKVKITYQQQGIKGTDEGNVSCDVIEKIVNDLRNGVITDMQIYLRPMQSMTEVERNIFDTMTRGYTIHQQIALFDWLNAHHFDYRGLIPTGLALEAPEGMYKI